MLDVDQVVHISNGHVYEDNNTGNTNTYISATYMILNESSCIIEFIKPDEEKK